VTNHSFRIAFKVFNRRYFFKVDGIISRPETEMMDTSTMEDDNTDKPDKMADEAADSHQVSMLFILFNLSLNAGKNKLKCLALASFKDTQIFPGIALSLPPEYGAPLGEGKGGGGRTILSHKYETDLNHMARTLP
jgi:hypothetical protein